MMGNSIRRNTGPQDPTIYLGTTKSQKVPSFLKAPSGCGQQIIFLPPKMESATNLIFLIAACASRSGGNAVRAPPRAHLAHTVPLVEPAAPGYPSSAQELLQGQVCFPACAHSTVFVLTGQAGVSGAGMPMPQPVPAEPGEAKGMSSAWSHLEPKAPVKHYSVTAESSPPSPSPSRGTQQSGSTQGS